VSGRKEEKRIVNGSTSACVTIKLKSFSKRTSILETLEMLEIQEILEIWRFWRFWRYWRFWKYWRFVLLTVVFYAYGTLRSEAL
jgi:hypothetical protein